MDKIINSKVNKQAIYEIYRACRLCGAGAGYKMPIIQNVLDIHGDEVELRQKIQECVQIEVHQDDKMPPLICELCVDKVNDFYEFIEMCRQTNKRTRLTLGLPLQTARKGASDGSDCILGVTEPVYVTKKEEESRSSPRHAKTKSTKDAKPTVKVKLEVKPKEIKESNTRSSRSLRGRSPSPRSTRQSRVSLDDNLSLNNFKNQSRKSKPSSPKTSPPQPKSILKKPVKTEISPSLRSKRLREPPKPDIPPKKVKLSVKPVVKSPPKPVKAPEFPCLVCKQKHKSPQALASHQRVHIPQYTSQKLACNSCCEWFDTPEATATHHKRHRAKALPYKCRGCGGTYRTAQAYDEHTSGAQCVPWVEVPDVKCEDCWRTFPTENLRSGHRCLGEDGRPGGKCGKCKRQYTLMRNLLKHEATCTAKRKANIKIDPELMGKVRPIQILVSKCDPLLERTSSDHYDVSAVPEYYGLHSKHKYPYCRPRLNLNSMVSIKTELDDFYCHDDYVHWDSDVTDDDDVTDRKVDSLSTLALKTLFSQKCLGRVPRKRRKVKPEGGGSVFDSLLHNEFDDMSKNIDSIIDNLGDEDDKDESKDSLFDAECNAEGTSEAKEDSVEKEVTGSSDNITKVPIENRDINSVVDKVDMDKQTVISDDSSVSEHVVSSNISVREASDKNDLENCEKECMEVDTIADDSRSIGDAETKDEEMQVNDGDDIIKDDAQVDGKMSNEDEQMVHSENVDDEKLEDGEEAIDSDKRRDEGNIKDDQKVKDVCDDDTVKDNGNSDHTIHEENTNDAETDKGDVNHYVDDNSKEVQNKNDDENCHDDEVQNCTPNDDSHVCDKGDNAKTYGTVDKKSLDIENNSEINNTEVINNIKGAKENSVNATESEHLIPEDNECKTANNKEDAGSTNGDVEEKTGKLNMEDFEIDDKKLMEALDEHIGETEKKDDNNDVENASSKITLEDLIPNKGSDTKSLDLDSISDDEFNFD